MMVGGFALKGQCLEPWADYHQYSSLCYNDIQPLSIAREVDLRTFPYVNGGLRGGELVGGAVEYPVLTGLFMWATGAFATSPDEYLVANALLLAPFGLMTAWLLGKMAGARALLFAAAPALALYAFHNWDLLAVAAATSGFYLWWRGHPVWAAVAFGVGAALKMYPILFVGPVALEALLQRAPRRALAIVGSAVGTFAVINLPFAIAGFDGWLATYEFHTLRGPNFDNIWAVRDFGPIHLPFLEPERLNFVTAILTGALFVTALAIGWWRGKRVGRYPVVAVSAALLAAFLLFNKVHSPQYALWIMLFFVLLRVPLAWWAGYAAVDLAVYIGVFRFFHQSCATNNCQLFDHPTGWQQLMTAGVFLRAFMLVALFAVFLLSRETPDAETDLKATRVPSHPPARVASVGDA
jgi:uncharacterized membrane protein